MGSMVETLPDNACKITFNNTYVLINGTVGV